MMNCRNCLAQDAYHVRTIYADGQVYDVCNKCGDLRMDSAAIHDVYLARPGQKFENLCDNMGRPYEIQSKRHKKEIMDRMGVSEAGDRVAGAPYVPKNWIEGSREWRGKQFEKDRPQIREVYKQYLDNVRRKRS